LLVGRETPEDDRVLVQRCQKGEECAFEQLVFKYQRLVFSLIQISVDHQLDFEDIAQKVFVKIYFALPKFDNKRPFFPWLYRIAVNQCYDELRRYQRRKVVTFTDLNHFEAEAIDSLMGQGEVAPMEVEDTQQLYPLLYKMLDRLPPQQRMALVLRDMQSIPYNKIADLMHCSEQAVRLKVFRARARLRNFMQKALRRQRSAR
jgi:RNA polymerase sigma-70 factor, ECF subfamily